MEVSIPIVPTVSNRSHQQIVGGWLLFYFCIKEKQGERSASSVSLSAHSFFFTGETQPSSSSSSSSYFCLCLCMCASLFSTDIFLTLLYRRKRRLLSHRHLNNA